MVSSQAREQPLKVIKKFKHIVTGETIVFTIYGQRRKCEELVGLLERKMQLARVWKQVQ